MDDTTNLVNARASIHGDFAIGAQWTQSVMEIAYQMPNWKTMSAAQRESVHMIVHKLQRILAGDHNYQDHWDDVGGYAKIGNRGIGDAFAHTTKIVTVPLVVTGGDADTGLPLSTELPVNQI